MLATHGSPGDLHPFLAIGVALQARGHEAIIATCERYQQAVLDAGLAFAAIRPDRQAGQQDPDFIDRILAERGAPARIFRDMFLPGLRESTVDLLPVVAGADTVVSHTLVAGGRLAAEVHGVPWISAVMQPMGYLSAYEPPIVGPPWIAGLLRRSGPGASRAVFRLAHELTGRWVGEWHELRSELGLPAVADHPIWEGQHSPVRSLGLFPRVLGEPKADWPASARVTGFPFYHPAGRTLDHGLKAFIEAGEPPIVFTLGTTAVNDPGSFYEVSAKAATDLGARAVLVAGPRSFEAFNGISDDVLAVPYAPHDLLFRHALAVVHQAGIGTLSEALRVGKPMLIMPYGHDQADNAWRAYRLGVARVITRGRYRREAVRRALRTILDGPRCHPAAARIVADLYREDGGNAAADAIENVLGGKGVRTP